ncbi:MAG: oligoribonuclease [Candidatus Nanopelagicaceae bacterium]
MTNGNAYPHLVWVDCEMTGLDTTNDVLVEIAVLVTDSELNIIGDGVDVVIKATPEQISGMNEFVTKMHTDSGLINEIPKGISVSAAEDLILKYLDSAGVVAGKSPLAGNSVYVDRIFITRDMPKLSEYLHYRTIDVSSIKELTRRWYPKVYFNAPAKTGNHRALGDIKDSIAELSFYRKTVFVDQPGPQSADIKQIASIFNGSNNGEATSSEG